jgi:hypothetical protein
MPKTILINFTKIVLALHRPGIRAKMLKSVNQKHPRKGETP